MASVYNRGTRAKPNWWVGWIDRSGQHRAQKVGPDRALAVQVKAKIENDTVAKKFDIQTEAPPPVPTFGEAADAAVRVHSVETDGPVAFAIDYAGATYRARLRIPGHHNAINAAGAFAVLVGLGHDPAAALAGIEKFGGTGRRFELHGTVGGVSVYDDYAHHPTEVAAALAAARTVVGDGRIIAVHQPHTYSRTQAFAQEFADVLEQYADETVVLDVYGAREDPVPVVTGALVSERFADASKVAFIVDWQEAADHTAKIARDGDFVITLGCGDVYRIVPQLLGSLERERE